MSATKGSFYTSEENEKKCTLSTIMIQNKKHLMRSSYNISINPFKKPPYYLTIMLFIFRWENIHLCYAKSDIFQSPNLKNG